MVDKKRVFISYGRKESLDFANRLYQALEQEGIDAWFDFANIPKGDDFQKRIDDGIEGVDNFIFVMSPHALQSSYCKKELSTAAKYNKRIIPIAHVEVADNDSAWQDIHQKTIKKLNWINFREKPETGVPQTEWAAIDDFDTAFKELLKVLGREASYVAKHTDILTAALHWDRKRRMQHHLLAGPELFEASEWLSIEFKAPEQPPCLPTDLQCEFICESIKNAHNLMTDVFMISDSWRNPYRDFIRTVLSRNKITTWRYASDVQAGMEEHQLIKEGIEGADNILFLVSDENVQSQKCLEELQLAISYNKRIIPIIIKKLSNKVEEPKELKDLSHIDFSDVVLKKEHNETSANLPKQVGALVNEIENDRDYFLKHKQLLTRALKWQRMDKNDSFLIRGYNLSEAQTWLQEGLTRNRYQPNKYHQEFLTASEAKVGVLQSEVFISYSQKNADFARKLNLKLQTFGKNTWFDQESLVGASNFEDEILKGISSSENFVFIITPQSVASEFCAKEVAHANQNNKRFIPILLEETAVDQIPIELKGVQWIDFKNKTFETAFGRLIQAINIDRSYVKQHTRLLQAALDWEEKGKSKDRLIRGEELKTAESWLDDALENKREPAVTISQRTFIEESEKLRIAEEKKEIGVRNLRRILRISAFAALAIIILILGYQFRESRLKELEASEKAALNYAFAAREVLNNEHAPERALSIIKEAVDIINDEALFKLLPFFRDISMSLNYVEMPHEAPVVGVDLSKDITNRQLLSFTKSEIKIWDLSGRLRHSLGDFENITHAGFSPDYSHIYIVKDHREIELISMSALKEKEEVFVMANSKGDIKNKTLKANDRIIDFQFFDEGTKILTVYEDIATRVWSSNGGWIYTLNHTGAKINGASISQDSKYVLTYSNDRTAKLWDVESTQQGSYKTTLRGHNSPVISAEISSDNKKALTLDTSGKAIIWDISNPLFPNNLKTYAGVAEIKFTKEPDLLVIRKKDLKVQLEDLEGAFFSELMTYNQFNTGIDSMQLNSSKDRVLTYAHNGTAALWRLNGQLLLEVDLDENDQSPNVSLDTDGTQKIMLSPSGSYIVKTNKKGQLQIWSGKTGNEIASFKAFKERIADLVFFPDNKQLVAASVDMTAKRWRFTENLFDTMITNSALEPSFLKQGIVSWLDSMNADSLKMAAKDKIRIGLMDDFEKIVGSADSTELYTYANYYKSEAEMTPDAKVKADNYNHALSLFKKINDTIAFRTIYSEVAEADILFETNALDDLKFPAFFTPEGLSEQLYLAQYITQKWARLRPTERISAYQFTYEVYKDILYKISEGKYQVSDERRLIIKRRASDNCNSLAYYYLLNGQLKEAISYAEEGMAIDSTYEWITTKLALAHLYDASFDKALPLLENMKGQKFGIDEYEKEMRRYIQKIDSTFDADSQEEKALPLTLPELMKVHERQLSPAQIELLDIFIPKQ